MLCIYVCADGAPVHASAAIPTSVWAKQKTDVQLVGCLFGSAVDNVHVFGAAVADVGGVPEFSGYTGLNRFPKNGCSASGAFSGGGVRYGYSLPDHPVPMALDGCATVFYRSWNMVVVVAGVNGSPCFQCWIRTRILHFMGDGRGYGSAADSRHLVASHFSFSGSKGIG